MTPDSPPSLLFEGLFHSSQDPLYVVNAQRRLVFFNRACETLTGVAAESVLGLECRQHGPFEPGDPASLAGSLCPPPSAFRGEPATSPALLIQPHGERVWRTIHFTPIAAADGELAAILGRIAGPASTPEPSNPDDSLPTALLRLRQRLYARFRTDSVVAASSPMRRVLQQVRLAAETRAHAILEGEKGVGKERLARTIHALSVAADRPFVTVDCEVLTPDLLYEELSSERLLAQRPAWATLYLREPVFLSRDLQTRLVRFLETLPNQAGHRVLAGSTKTRKQFLEEGSFSGELLDLVSTLVISVPPLRERGPDIPLLAQQILEQCNAAGAHQLATLQPGAGELLQAYSWPGNVAQLDTLIRTAHERACGSELRVEDLPRIVREAAELARLPTAEVGRPLPLNELLATAERRIIQLALRDAGGNLTGAAARLGVSRARLHRRLSGLGLLESPGGTEPGIVPAKRSAESPPNEEAQHQR